MPALTNVDLRLLGEEPHGDAYQARGNLTIRHGDPEHPHELDITDPTSLVELAVVVADALAYQARGNTLDLHPNTRARLDRAVQVLDQVANG